MAPMTSVPPSSLIPASPDTLPRSIKCLGWARRSFIAGSRLCPPASSLASSLYLARRSTASFTVPALWYSNWAGYIGVSLLLRFGGLDGFPDPLRRERHGFDVVDAEARQGIHHGIDDGRRGSDRPRLSSALDAERVDRRRRLRAPGLVHRQHVGPGQRVVHQAAGHQLSRLFVVDGPFPEGLRNALGDASVDHPVHDHGVDDVADVVHGDVAKDLHVAGVAIDLHDAGVSPERETEVRRIVKARLLEPGLETFGIVVRHVRGQGDRAPGHRLAGSAAHLELPADVLDVAGRGLEQMRRDLFPLLL